MGTGFLNSDTISNILTHLKDGGFQFLISYWQPFTVFMAVMVGIYLFKKIISSSVSDL